MAFYEMLPGAGTTPITPTLITKTITENGTYSAEDDGADGYSEVTVNVPTGGEEIPFTHVFTAGTATDQYYTPDEDGIYLVVGIRDQSIGCSIDLPDGGTTILSSVLLSNRAQMKVVSVTAGQRIHLYLYDSSHMRGGWIFKLNTTTPTLEYSNGYSSASIPNHGTSTKVLSVIALAPITDNTIIWDKTMKCYVRGTYSVSNRYCWLRLMYGTDSQMPTISFSGGIGGQWLINLG